MQIFYNFIHTIYLTLTSHTLLKVIETQHERFDMTRTSISDLRFLVKRLNEVTDSPQESYIRDPQTKRLTAQIGNYHLSQAYGGVQLHRMCNEGGGIKTPISMGYETKKDAYRMIQAFLYGIQSTQEES